MNIPISAAVDSKFNPWNIMKIRQASAGKSKNRFVVVKLDIDTPQVELPLVEQFVKDDSVQVDEFFFEHHTKFKEMAPFWGPAGGMAGMLSDTYDFMLKLRKRGVRAHAWP